jgi:kynurenine 3-monooxygenase
MQDQSNNVHNHIAIIGGGPVGLTLAIMLANKGLQVDLYEKRKLYLENPELSNGRNTNIILFHRALKAFEKVGVLDEILQNSPKMYKS